MDVDDSVYDNLDELVSYLTYRASVEKVAMELPLEFFAFSFIEGVRSFFGIEVNDEGRMTGDCQQPELLKNWMTRN